MGISYMKISHFYRDLCSWSLACWDQEGAVPQPSFHGHEAVPLHIIVIPKSVCALCHASSIVLHHLWTAKQTIWFIFHLLPFTIYKLIIYRHTIFKNLSFIKLDLEIHLCSYINNSYYRTMQYNNVQTAHNPKTGIYQFICWWTFRLFYIWITVRYSTFTYWDYFFNEHHLLYAPRRNKQQNPIVKCTAI